MWILAIKNAQKADLTNRRNSKCQKCLRCLQKHHLQLPNPFNLKKGVDLEPQSREGDHQKEIEDHQDEMIESIQREDIRPLQVRHRLMTGTEVEGIDNIMIGIEDELINHF